MYLAAALLIPGSLLVFLPVSEIAGVVSAIVLFGAAVGALILWVPGLEEENGVFRVAAARIARQEHGEAVAGVFRAGAPRVPRDHVGEPVAFRREQATAARGVDLDARAWLCIRGW